MRIANAIQIHIRTDMRMSNAIQIRKFADLDMYNLDILRIMSQSTSAIPVFNNLLSLMVRYSIWIFAT